MLQTNRTIINHFFHLACHMPFLCLCLCLISPLFTLISISKSPQGERNITISYLKCLEESSSLLCFSLPCSLKSEPGKIEVHLSEARESFPHRQIMKLPIRKNSELKMFLKPKTIIVNIAQQLLGTNFAWQNSFFFKL